MSLSQMLKRAFGLSHEPIDEEEFDASLPTYAAEFRDPVPEDTPTETRQPDRVPTLGEQTTDTRLAGERRQMMNEVERLRSDNQQMEQLRQQMEQQRLSAERQKRAMSDRILDLQNQVLQLEDTLDNLRRRPSANTAPATPATPAQPKVETIEVENLRAEADTLRAEVQRLTTLNDQLDTKSRMADKMLSDITGKLAEAKQQNTELQDTVAQFSHLEEQFEQVQQLMERKDSRIAQLTQQLEEQKKQQDTLTQKVAKLKNERESLRRTIEQNLYNQAHSESALRREIKSLSSQLEKTGKTPKPKKPKTVKTEADIPDPGPDFGYQAPPKRKSSPAEDSQPTLW